MSGFRNRPRTKFTMVRNSFWYDRSLSIKAKGLMGIMLSFPDDWTYHLSHLQTLSKDGRDSVRSGIRELEAAGYIRRQQIRNEDGTLGGMAYQVADYKIAVPDEESTVDGIPDDGMADDGKGEATNKDLTKNELTKKEGDPPTEDSGSATPKNPSSSFQEKTREESTSSAGATEQASVSKRGAAAKSNAAHDVAEVEYDSSEARALRMMNGEPNDKYQERADAKHAHRLLGESFTHPQVQKSWRNWYATHTRNHIEATWHAAHQHGGRLQKKPLFLFIDALNGTAPPLVKTPATSSSDRTNGIKNFQPGMTIELPDGTRDTVADVDPYENWVLLEENGPVRPENCRPAEGTPH